MESEMDLTNLLGIVAGTLTTTSFAPGREGMVSRHTKDISFSCSSCSSRIVLWLAYGIIKRISIAFANALSFILVATILSLK